MTILILVLQLVGFWTSLSRVWENGQWNLAYLRTPLPEHIIQKILAVQVPRIPTGSDVVTWLAIKHGVYTASSAYSWFLNHPTDSHSIWKKIWRLEVPENIHFFIWQAFFESLPTNCKRHACHLATHSGCYPCFA
ncbi:hypothetical protein CR513_08093, partial [Mucuna pruriens]